jgi:hypothetical protein
LASAPARQSRYPRWTGGARQERIFDDTAGGTLTASTNGANTYTFPANTTHQISVAWLGGGGTGTVTISCGVIVNASPSAGNANNVGGSLHQSTRQVTRQTTAASITTITNSIESGITGQFGGLGGFGAAPGGVGGAVSSSAPIDPGNPNRSPGLTGYGISGRQAFTMLAQAAGSAIMRSDASGGGLPADPAKQDTNQQLAQGLTLGPTSLTYNPNKPFGAFLMGSYSGVGSSQNGGQFHGTIQDIIAGADYKFTPNFLAGLALGYEMSSITTAYNFGSLKGNGFTVMPYVAWHQDNIQWDAMIGAGQLQDRAEHRHAVHRVLRCEPLLVQNQLHCQLRGLWVPPVAEGRSVERGRIRQLLYRQHRRGAAELERAYPASVPRWRDRL